MASFTKLGLALAVLAAVVLAAGGCQSVPVNQEGARPAAYDPRDFDPAGTAASAAARNPAQVTSLWTENNRENWLFTDHKARAVNDIVTIKIVEQSKAKKEAKTTLGKDSSMEFGVKGLAGLESMIPKFVPQVNMGSLIGTSGKRTFDGSGQTERTGELVATMSAIVTQVLPNGNLVIEGKRLVRVNNEEQVMILSGVIRPRDVAADNSILSSMIADAKICYSGQGVIADKQRPGWLHRGLDKISPF